MVSWTSFSSVSKCLVRATNNLGVKGVCRYRMSTRLIDDPVPCCGSSPGDSVLRDGLVARVAMGSLIPAA